MRGATHRAESVCPFCGTETGIPRTGTIRLPGNLRIGEFEVMVRNEWRRRLGPDAYPRAHPRGVVRALADSAHSNPLEDEVVAVMADLRAEGAGRRQIRREFAKLVHGIRAVLRHAGATSDMAEQFVVPAREALEEAMAFPPPGSNENAPPTRQQIRIPLLGVSCLAGGRLPLEKALSALSGVVAAFVNPVTESAYLTIEPSAFDMSEVLATAHRFGARALDPQARAKRSGSRHPVDERATR